MTISAAIQDVNGFVALVGVHFKKGRLMSPWYHLSVPEPLFVSLFFQEGGGGRERERERE